ncbi:AI-2E family transporter [Halobacteria archaeon AArc-m2/3/4]|uniref:AI-2E family transporter n=1 Tax=Natronoglomus mannanivorans TaxID=2979990 RepID=A0AAP3E3L2_9EURY|nr:AI-2E family transporter [Halobacteria archaeon AArc-xg1-1]MCU4972192.1 AI-2E family transporter [Halobacteria archaeon AArc-m2/3/4]
MTRNRTYVLAGVVVALGAITGAILLEVLGTILFAITIAYVLAPVQRWLVRRGASEWTAGVLATLVGFVSVLAVLAPIVLTLYLRVDEVVAFVRALPDEFSVTVFETTMTLQSTEIQSFAVSTVQGIAGSIATAAPVLAVKFALFVLLLFGLLLKGDAAARAAVAPVPREYRDIVFALATRARETLYAIYVIQVATGVATFVVAYPFFWMIGYDAAFMLAIGAAILQFVPIIGPSLLIAPLALYHLALGDLVTAALVGGIGIALIAWMPDVTVRPQLAQRSAGLPGSLYFVGFTGGLFTLGAIGIVVGPLIVAVFVEAVELLADEVNGDRPLEELLETPDADSGERSESELERDLVSESETEGAGAGVGTGTDPEPDIDPRSSDDVPPSSD